MDERFRENIARAKLKAYRITFGVMFAALVTLCQAKIFGNLEYTLIAAIIILSLALALGGGASLNICCIDMTMTIRLRKAGKRIWQKYLFFKD